MLLSNQENRRIKPWPHNAGMNHNIFAKMIALEITVAVNIN